MQEWKRGFAGGPTSVLGLGADGVCFTTMRKSISSCLAFTTAAIFCAALPGQQSTPRAPKPEETELWHPVPRVVTPGAECGAPPSDAIILFDGKNLDQWVSSKDKSPAKWSVASGVSMIVQLQGRSEGALLDVFRVEPNPSPR